MVDPFGIEVDPIHEVNFFFMRFILFTLPLLLLVGCRGVKGEEERSSPRPVKSQQVEVATTQRRVFAGLSTPDEAVNLAFRMGGQVVDFPVSKGAWVERGALIAELDPREIRLEVEANRSAFEEAASQRERMRRLLAHEAISQQEYEMANTRYAQARSSLKNSEALLKECRILAPFSGVIERTYVDTYERVAAGAPIARLVNPATRTVSFTLPENLLQIFESPSTHFEVAFDNYPGHPFRAEVKNFARTSSDASGFPASLRLLGSDFERYPITPGLSCQITMQSASPLQGALSIPMSAIYAPPQGGTYVWVINPKGRVERRSIELGELLPGDRVVVEKGLTGGEKIVTAGTYHLQEGEAVKIIPSNHE